MTSGPRRWRRRSTATEQPHPRMAWMYCGSRETVEGGAVWVCRTVGAMDGAIEPPWVRALCLRSTASQAPERTAASGWAGPRKGGLRRVLPAHTAPPNQQKTRAALALALGCCRPAAGTPRVQGAALPTHPPLRTKTISLFSANRHPFATPVPYCGAACAHGRPMLKNARPSLRSIQDDIAMAGSWGSGNRTYQATRTVQLPLHGDSDNVTSN